MPQANQLRRGVFIRLNEVPRRGGHWREESPLAAVHFPRERFPQTAACLARGQEKQMAPKISQVFCGISQKPFDTGRQQGLIPRKICALQFHRRVQKVYINLIDPPSIAHGVGQPQSHRNDFPLPCSGGGSLVGEGL